MAPKRKADDNRTGTRHPAARARTDTISGEDLAGTSAQTEGPTENAAGDCIAWTSQALAGLTTATIGSAGGSSQFGGAREGGAWSGQRGFAPPHQRPLTGQTATTAAFAVGGAARGAGGGSGYRGFSQPHRREPYQGMLPPPMGNPTGQRPPLTHQYHAPNGHGQLPSQNQIAGPLQTGTGPPRPRGHSGSGGPSSAISCASAAGAPVSPLVGQECPRCKMPMIVFSGLGPVCADCYTNLVLSTVRQKHPEIRYMHPRPVPSHGGAPPGAAAAITPSSSSSSSSICQYCGHPFRLFCLLCFDKDPALSSDDS